MAWTLDWALTFPDMLLFLQLQDSEILQNLNLNGNKLLKEICVYANYMEEKYFIQWKHIFYNRGYFKLMLEMAN